MSPCKIRRPDMTHRVAVACRVLHVCTRVLALLVPAVWCWPSLLRSVVDNGPPHCLTYGPPKLLNIRLWWWPSLLANVIDTTGAGDCFRGTFAASLALGKPVQERCKATSASPTARLSCVYTTAPPPPPPPPRGGEQRPTPKPQLTRTLQDSLRAGAAASAHCVTVLGAMYVTLDAAFSFSFFSCMHIHVHRPSMPTAAQVEAVLLANHSAC